MNGIDLMLYDRLIALAMNSIVILIISKREKELQSTTVMGRL
jgi:hypothetical protein